jgi:hypothetical protein
LRTCSHETAEIILVELRYLRARLLHPSPAVYISKGVLANPATTVDIAAAAEQISAVFVSFKPLIDRLVKLLKKRSRRKEARASVALALSALEKLQASLDNLTEIGWEFVDILEEAKVPASVTTSVKLYRQLAKWLDGSAELVYALAAVVNQAEELAKIDSFMDELKGLDKALYEFVKLLARCKKDGSLDFSGLPAFVAVYVRHEREKTDLELRVKDIVEPLMDKAERVGESLQPPFRKEVPQLKRAFEKAGEAGKKLAPLSDTTQFGMRKASTGWAILSLDLVDVGLKVGLDVSRRKIAREPPAPPRLKGGAPWPRETRHR